MMRRLRKTAADLRLPFGQRERTYNSRLAQELGLWAESKSKGDVFHMAVFKAYFVDGKNIAKIPVLLDLAASVSLAKKLQQFLRKGHLRGRWMQTGTFREIKRLRLFLHL
jgi:predicted DsbA family dithiol-disulfide isomerase